MQAKIYILTGAKHSGKTTALQQFCANKKGEAKGILSIVENEERFFVNIATNTKFSMQAKENSTATLAVGRFVFCQQAFNYASKILTTTTNCNFLIIDEVGPLELKKQGFNDALTHILNKPLHYSIIIVVREGLVQEIIKFFELKNAIVIFTKDLLTI